MLDSTLRHFLLSVPVALAVAACGDDGGSGTTDEPTTAPTTAGPSTTEDPTTTTDPSTTGTGTTDPTTTTGEPAGFDVFRFDSMVIHDPHFFASGFDVSDMVNGQLADAITSDMDDPPDGVLDLSLVLRYDPFDPNAGGGPVEFGPAECLVPYQNSICSPPLEGTFTSTTYTDDPTSCMEPDPAVLNPDYGPLMTVPGVCFNTVPLAEYVFDIGQGIFVRLLDAELSAQYSGDPVDSFANGLMRGFLTEEEANNTTLPDSLPLVGGQPLANLLKDEDKDDHNGTPGWWFYLRFTAIPAKWME